MFTKLKSIILHSSLFMLMIGCTSTSPYKTSEVVERIGNKSETPEWTTGEITMSEENGKVFFVNTISMSGDSRAEACTRAASDSARVEILRHIKDNLTASGQISETSASSDPGVESLVAFLSQGKLSGVTVAQKYWEKRTESDATGSKVLRLHCAAKVAIPKQELSRQLRDAIGSGGNPEIRKQLLESQKNFIDGIGREAPSVAH